MRLGFGMPYVLDIRGRTAMSAIAALHGWTDELVLIEERSAYTHWNQEKIVRRAIEAAVDYLWFVEADVVFPPHTLRQLFSCDKEIVGCTYNYRELPLRSTVRILNSDGTSMKCPFEAMPNKPFSHVAGRPISVPTGCMLIKMSVFERLRPPYFTSDYGSGEKVQSGDVSFCKLAIEAGIPVWCDPTIRVEHSGEYLY